VLRLYPTDCLVILSTHHPWTWKVTLEILSFHHSGTAISSRVSLLPVSPLSSYRLQGTRCGALGLRRHHNQEDPARTRVIWLLRRVKGEKGFRMIVIVLLLCDGKSRRGLWNRRDVWGFGKIGAIR
jgi:hypothetical protein